MIQCMYGTKMEIHMAYQFTYTEWNNFPYAERTRILEELAQSVAYHTTSSESDRITPCNYVSCKVKVCLVSQYLNFQPQ